jgi:hypothetical protein
MAVGPVRRSLRASRTHRLRPRRARPARPPGKSRHRSPAVTVRARTLRKFRPQPQLKPRPRLHSPPLSHRASLGPPWRGRHRPGRHRLLLLQRSLSLPNGLGERRHLRPQPGWTRQRCRNKPPPPNPPSTGRPSPGRPSPGRLSTGQLSTGQLVIERLRRLPDPPGVVNPRTIRPAKAPGCDRARPNSSLPRDSGRLPGRSSQKTSPAARLASSGNSRQGSTRHSGLASRPCISSLQPP